MYELGGQIVSIRLPKMGISAEVSAGLGRTRNCLGVLLVTEPPMHGYFAAGDEAVCSVCAPEDEWDFWTGFEVAASKLQKPHVSYELLINELRPLVKAALRTRRQKSSASALANQSMCAPEGSGLGYMARTPSQSIIPAELKTTIINSPDMCNQPHLSEWDGGAYCTAVWADPSDTPGEETSAGGAWGRTRKEAFRRWLNKTHEMPEFRTRHWKGYFAAFPQDRKGGSK